MDKILELFLREPEREFYVREIAKLVGKSPTTVSKYLKEYEKKGILKSEEKFNHLLFRANSESSKFKQMKVNYNIELLRNSGMVDFLGEKFNTPSAIVLFGSFARGEDREKSDVDILVVSSKKGSIDLKKYEKKIGNEIQLFIYSKNDLEKLKKSNKELINKFVNGIVLEGFLEI